VRVASSFSRKVAERGRVPLTQARRSASVTRRPRP
jgi:hypothetical protein